VPDTCPRECHCSTLSEGGLSIDCSGKGLQHPPEVLPSNTVELLLNGNSISAIFDDTFQHCRQLSLLDLTFNSITQLSVSSFTTVPNIEQLRLNDNKLHYQRMPNGVFRALTKLRVLHLHNNDWTDLTAYPDELFEGLQNVEMLSIDCSSEAKFGEEFLHLSRLQTLHIYGGLQEVRNRTFAVFRRLAIVEISLKTKLSLSNFEPESFSHFPMLRTLDLGYNQNIGFQNVSNAWWGLQFTQITKLILTRIVPPDEQAARVTESFFEFLDLTTIEYLLLNQNNIVELAPKLSITFPRLRYLDLSYNRLSYVWSFVKDLVMLKNLEYFDCSHQTKRFVPAVETRDDVLIEYSDANVANNELTIGKDDQNLQPPDSWFSTCKLQPFKPCGSRTLQNAVQTRQVVDENGQPLPANGTWCLMIPSRLSVLNLTESLNVDLQTLPAVVVIADNSRLSLIEYRNNGIKNLVKPQS
jgi:Leucine-rich repeat (LRR) protein